MFKKIFGLFKATKNKTHSVPRSLKANILPPTLPEIREKQQIESNKKAELSLDSVKTDICRSSQDSLEKYLVQCTFSQIRNSNNSALQTLFKDELVHLRSSELNRLDLEFRKLISEYVTAQNREYFLRILKSNKNEYLTLVFTMWSDGYVREAAVNQLSTLQPTSIHLTLLLLRLNDWNYFVHYAAKTTLRSTITMLPYEALIPTIPALIRLKKCHRHLTEIRLNEFLALYRTAIPEPNLLAQLYSSEARSVAELLWSADLLSEEVLQALCAAPDPFIKFKTLRTHVPSLEKACQLRLAISLPQTNWTPAKLERLELLQKLQYNELTREWITSLTDSSKSVRQYCVFYLEEVNFDIESHYIERLKDVNLKTQKNALHGLVEIKSKTASLIIQQWLSSENPSKLTTALILINSEEVKAQENLIIQSLRSSTPSLRKAAFKAAQKIPYNTKIESLVWDDNLPPRNQQLAAKLATRAELWYSLLLALKFVTHKDHTIRIEGQSLIEKDVLKFCNTFTRPDGVLKDIILEQLELVKELIPSKYTAEIKSILQTPR